MESPTSARIRTCWRVAFSWTSLTPATIRWAGQPLGAHNHEVYGELGLDKAELEELAREDII